MFLTDKKIRITGNVTFNSNVVLSGCKVLIDPGSVVTMKGVFYCKKSVTGSTTTISGCQSMWNSIVISSGALVKLLDCTITDGEKGLVFENGYNAAYSVMQRCTLDRNLTAITADGVSNFSFSQFEGNLIKSGLNPNLMLAPYTANSQLIGISVKNSSGTIGTAGNANRFTGLSSGIRAISSTLSVNNCSFRYNLRPSYASPNHPGAVNVNSGIGIESIASYLQIAGSYSNNFSCIFERNRIDIYSYNTNGLIVDNASFTDPVVTSINVINSFSPNTVSITQCPFTLPGTNLLPTQALIQINRASQTTGTNTTFSRNTIKLQRALTTSPNDMIMVKFTAQSGAKDKCLISWNVIECSHGNPLDGTATRTTDAFRIFGEADGYQIEWNRIYFDDPMNLGTIPNATITNIGIGVDNNTGINNVIADNELHGAFFTTTDGLRKSWLRCGTHLLNAPNFKICRNKVENGTNHFHFLDNSSNFEFGKNTTSGRGKYGLIVDNGPIPNNHDHRRNLWLGTYETFGAEHDMPQVGLLWRADGTINGHIPTTQSPSNWIKNFPDNDSLHFCDSGLALADESTSVKEVTKKFLEGTFSFAGSASKWDFEKELVEQLIRFPEAQSSSIETQQYYNGKTGTVQGQLADARSMLHKAATPDGIEEGKLRSLYAENQVIMDSIRLLESIAAIDSTVFDTLLHKHIDQLIQHQYQIQEQAASLLQSMTTTRNAALELLLNGINSIPATETIETNYKTIISLMTVTEMGLEWKESEIKALRDIAKLCYEEYGLSVLIARQLLPVEEQHNYLSIEVENPDCGRPHGEAHPRSAVYETTLRVVPNPANQAVNIYFEADFSGTVQWYTATGLVVREQKCTHLNWIPTDVSAWPNGVYWLRCISDSGLVQHKELVIQH